MDVQDMRLFIREHFYTRDEETGKWYSLVALLSLDRIDR